jgi:hypothetical protein
MSIWLLVITDNTPALEWSAGCLNRRLWIRERAGALLISARIFLHCQTERRSRGRPSIFAIRHWPTRSPPAPRSSSRIGGDPLGLQRVREEIPPGGGIECGGALSRRRPRHCPGLLGGKVGATVTALTEVPGRGVSHGPSEVPVLRDEDLRSRFRLSRVRKAHSGQTTGAVV